MWNEIEEGCSRNEGKDQHIKVIGGKARRKETTRKTKT
jgi:hypothetical protein